MRIATAETSIRFGDRVNKGLNVGTWSFMRVLTISFLLAVSEDVEANAESFHFVSINSRSSFVLGLFEVSLIRVCFCDLSLK